VRWCGGSVGTTSGLRPKVTLKSRALFLLNSQTFQNFKQSQNSKDSPNSSHNLISANFYHTPIRIP
jgi:hypothetical protein